jgi:hypothetical protein
VSGLNQSVSQLDAALTVLRQRWNAAHAVWDDAVARGFERDVWQAIESQARAAERQMERLAQVIAQAERVVR